MGKNLFSLSVKFVNCRLNFPFESSFLIPIFSFISSLVAHNPKKNNKNKNSGS